MGDEIELKRGKEAIGTEYVSWHLWDCIEGAFSFLLFGLLGFFLLQLFYFSPN